MSCAFRAAYVLVIVVLGFARSAMAADVQGPAYPNAELTGRVQLDSGSTIRHEGRSERLENQADFRRIRLNLEGDFHPDWHYRLQADTRFERQTLLDALLSYHGVDDVVIRAGHFTEYNGLEAFAGSRDLMLFERAEAITGFRAVRSFGLGIEKSGQGWGLQGGVFGDDMNASAPDKGGVAFGVRGFILPIQQEDGLLHLGLNGRSRHNIKGHQLRFSARGGVAMPEVALLSAGWISDVGRHDTFGAELYATRGPVFWAAEYQQNSLSRNSGRSALHHHGGYATIGWFLTGEQREYDVRRGSYTQLLPDDPFDIRDLRGSGAWEVVARYQFVDMNDADLQRGRLDGYSLGLNWYPDAAFKMMLQYTWDNLDKNAALSDEDPQFLTLRAQWDF